MSIKVDMKKLQGWKSCCIQKKKSTKTVWQRDLVWIITFDGNKIKGIFEKCSLEACHVDDNNNFFGHRIQDYLLQTFD